MSRSAFRWITFVLVMAGLGEGLVAGRANAGDWRVSVAGGYTTSYAYHRYSIPGFGSFPDAFGSTGMITAGVTRRLSEQVSVVAEAGAMSFRNDLLLAVPAFMRLGPTPTARLEQTTVPLSVALRWSPTLQDNPHVRPFVEAAPAVYFTHWTERHTNPEGSDSFRAALAGWSAGGGLEFALTRRFSMDTRFRYLWSRDAGWHDLEFSGGRFLGLRQGVFIVGSSLAL